MRRSQRTYSKSNRQALDLLAQRIKIARKERRMSETDLAERVGIARSTLQKIEKGEPQVDIGIFFEAAVITGVPLFEPEGTPLAPHIERGAEKLALLPGAIHKRRNLEVDDDF